MEQYSLKNLIGKLILFATVLASGMSFLDGTVVNIAIPIIQSKFHANLIDMQWIINGYSLMLSALILISGALGDRFGRKRIFLYGITLFILASFLCSIAQTTTQLIIYRALEGIGAAMMIPGSLSIINVAFREQERGKVIGLWSGCAGAIAALGPFLGGWLVQTLGWQSIFYINIPLGLLALFITVRFVPESKNQDAKNIDLFGTICILVSLLGIVYGLINGPTFGWMNWSIITSLIGGFIFFILFILIEKNAQEPLVPFSLFKSPLVIGANIATTFLYFALNGVIFFLVLNFQQIQKYSPIMAGLGLLPTILLITFLSGPAGAVADKIGPRLPMIIGPLLVSVGMLLFIFPGLHANYFLQYLPGLILFGVGMAIVIAPLTKSALAVDRRYSGAASGVNNAIARIAGLLAVALLGAIILTLFLHRLDYQLQTSGLNISQQNEIRSQGSKLGGIEIPKDFSSQATAIAYNVIDTSFIFGFRWIIGIAAFLAFLSVVVSYITIDNPRYRKKASVVNK